MLNPILQSFEALLEMIFRYELGTNEFYVVLGATLFVMCIVARVLVGIFGGKRGIIQASLGVLIPLLLAGLGFVLVELYALPQFTAEWAALYLPWVGFGIMMLLGVVLFTRLLFSFGPGFCIFLFLLIGASGAVAYFCAGAVVEFLDNSADQMEKRDDRLNNEISGIE